MYDSHFYGHAVRQIILAIPLLVFLAACQALAPQAPPAPDPEQSTVIFFKDDSAELDADARDIVGRAAEAARSQPDQRVRVLGFASAESGTDDHNQALSQQRATAVADGLVAAGVERDRVTIEPLGTLAFGLSPLESRRVEILIGR
jgi:outer membrane protein OmpA-like peptidoglycan-associated protein